MKTKTEEQLSEFQDRFYNTTIFSLRDIVIELRRLNEREDRLAGGAPGSAPCEPYWDEGRDALRLPELGCYLADRVRTEDGDGKPWPDMVAAAKADGQRLPTSDEACSILRHAVRINSLLVSRGREPLRGWFWTSTSDGKDLAYAYSIGEKGAKCLGMSLRKNAYGAIMLSD